MRLCFDRLSTLTLIFITVDIATGPMLLLLRLLARVLSLSRMPAFFSILLPARLTHVLCALLCFIFLLVTIMTAHLI